MISNKCCVLLLALASGISAQNAAKNCTGTFKEWCPYVTQRPPPNTKCASECYGKGRWGDSWCYTDDDEEQWGAPCEKCYPEKEWELVAEKKYCDGSEFNIGVVSTLEECAKKCVWTSMFLYGTNDFGGGRCDGRGCKCFCESGATTLGTCDLLDHNGYRLYKYKIADMCTGKFEVEYNRPPAGTKCAGHCVNKHGYWGASYCYTDKDEKQWGAECVSC